MTGRNVADGRGVFIGPVAVGDDVETIMMDTAAPANGTTSALVLIEYQNDFTAPGGVQHDAVRAVMAHTDMMRHSRVLLDGARARGMTVLHAPITFAAGYPELPSEPYGILAGVVQSKAFRKNSWGAEIDATMAPTAGEIVIEGKRGLDCFATTNLGFILRQRGITRVALAGFLTNCCVGSTMRSAYERGYDVVTLTDCTATLSIEAQEAAVNGTFPMFSRPMTASAFLAEHDEGATA
ncbi:cysteine hydrolase [Sphingomonas sp. BT552]|uniref:Cysteine hydrolase n=2 Tax=Sphingomonas longa TaxID=2778730 RepID=A0ABS2DBI2_9SPHN|nr:cysteine hydrolase [Microvirga sp. SRT01]MBM6578297.1 cysteine hydrolase [Sphingomonas sp. BT552]